MMKKRGFAQKERGKVQKQRRPILLLLTEGGKNKTETNYFSYFRSHGGKYRIVVTRSGDTDPEGMLSALKKQYDEYELTSEFGDLAYVVLDLDCKDDRANEIVKLNSQEFPFVVSNPCIEVWFLAHYLCSSHEFLDSKEVIRELQKPGRIPGYSKNMSVYPLLLPRMKDAIDNENELIKCFGDRKWPSTSCNPRSDVVNLIPFLTAQQDDF